jgi:prevent-host-death family protein
MPKRDVTMPAAEFKARCLRVMGQVSRTRRPVTITKRGRPVARLVPVDSDSEPFLDSLGGQVTVAGDLEKAARGSDPWETETEWVELCRENPPQ